MDNKQLAQALIDAQSRATVNLIRSGNPHPDKVYAAVLREFELLLNLERPTTSAPPDKKSTELTGRILLEMTLYLTDSVLGGDQSQRRFDKLAERIGDLIERFRRDTLDQASQSAADAGAKLDEVLKHG